MGNFDKPCPHCGYVYNVRREKCPACGLKRKEKPEETERPAQIVEDLGDLLTTTDPVSVNLPEGADAPAPPPPPRKSAREQGLIYLATRDGIGSVNGVSCSVRSGQVIADENMAENMIEAGMPIALVAADSVTVCPHCSKAFSMPAKRRAQG